MLHAGRVRGNKNIAIHSILTFILCRYRPAVKVAYITTLLGFVSEEECEEFLMMSGAILNGDGTAMDCKSTLSNLSSS